MKIIMQKNGNWNEQDRLALAALLIKAGYVVSIGKEKIAGKNTYVYYVEYAEQGNLEQ